jgi:MoaA/NifB/PqqE/SkfB family radical SAM enzyme
MTAFCGGCATLGRDASCEGAFARGGITTVHWECWSDCNLSCAFCYRSRTKPLDSAGGVSLARAVAAGGARRLVFAGGDPSLRLDLPQLATAARELDLRVEIQTNAHVLSGALLAALPHADAVGLSIDGATPEVHDAFRGKPGNFARVTRLLGVLVDMGVPVNVRTVVTRENHRSVAGIAGLLQPLPNVRRWSLMEFTPLGDGLVNQDHYTLDRRLFDAAAAAAAAGLRGGPVVDIYRNTDKVGTYALVSSDGTLYGVSGGEAGPEHRVAGSLLHDHLSALANRLPFSESNHLRRYRLDVTE